MKSFQMQMNFLVGIEYFFLHFCKFETVMYLNTDRSIGEYSDASLDKISGKASKAATASAEPHVAPVLNGAHFLLISLT